MARRKGPDLSVAELESLLAQQKSRVTPLGKKRAELQAELDSVEKQFQSLQGSTPRTGKKNRPTWQAAQKRQSLASVVTGILEKSPKGLSLDDLTHRSSSRDIGPRPKAFRTSSTSVSTTQKRFGAKEKRYLSAISWKGASRRPENPDLLPCSTPTRCSMHSTGDCPLRTIFSAHRERPLG
ncbi:MAG: hypothetical protein CM1200mP2_34470 [Planctomycetaceae bacterium]|nr:MAG: hypothetical protein CM1200mP2_34470 [Planctomycetaceae bacterium]